MIPLYNYYIQKWLLEIIFYKLYDSTLVTPPNGKGVIMVGGKLSNILDFNQTFEILAS